MSPYLKCFNYLYYEIIISRKLNLQQPRRAPIFIIMQCIDFCTVPTDTHIKDEAEHCSSHLSRENCKSTFECFFYQQFFL